MDVNLELRLLFSKYEVILANYGKATAILVLIWTYREHVCGY